MRGECRRAMLPDLLHSDFIDAAHSTEESGKYMHGIQREAQPC
jgi:hypothetical protein